MHTPPTQRERDGIQHLIASGAFYAISLFLLLTIVIGYDYGARLLAILYPFAIYFLAIGIKHSIEGGNLLR